jgi:hypothetical protein
MRDGTRVPITSGNCCPLDALNRGCNLSPGDLQSRQAGAGNQVHPPSDIRCTKVRSGEAKSTDVITRPGKIVSDLGFPARISRRLLHDNPFCSGVEPSPEHVGPEGFASPVSMDSRRNAGVLARGSSETDVGRGRWDGLDIFMDRYSREVVEQDLPTPRVDFAQRGYSMPSPLKAQGVTTYTREQVKDSQTVTTRPPNTPPPPRSPIP